MAPCRRRMAAAVTLSVLIVSGVLITAVAPATAQTSARVTVHRLQFGDFRHDIDDFRRPCTLSEPCKDVEESPGRGGVGIPSGNLQFPPTFLDRISPAVDLRYGNTPLTCVFCLVETAFGIWVTSIQSAEGAELQPGHTITVNGPAGTVFSDNRLDYVLADTRQERITEGWVFGPAFHPTLVTRLPNSVRMVIPVGLNTASDRQVFVWMANTVNPPAGTYSGFDFRVETTDQSTFPGFLGGEFTFDADSPVKANSRLNASSRVVTAGEAVDLIATIRDRYGNPVAGEDVAIVPGNGSATVARDPQPLTQSNGEARFSYTDQRAESVQFNGFALNSEFAIGPVTVSFVAAAPSPDFSDVVFQTEVVADGDAAAVVEVRLADAFANPTVNHEVVLVPTPVPGGPSNVFVGGSVSAAPGSECTAPVHDVEGVACARTVMDAELHVDSNGDPVRQAVARFLVRNPKAETVRFVVNALTKPAALEQTAVVTFLAGAPTSATISPAQQSVVADGTATGSVSVLLRDTRGNPVPGVDVTLSATPGAEATIDPPATRPTQADGRATFSVRDGSVESVTFTATYAGTVNGQPVSGTVPGSAVVDFGAGPTSAALSTFTADPTSRLADGNAAASLAVTLLDSAGRPSAGQQVVVTGNTGHRSTVTPVLVPVAASGCPSQAAAGTSDCAGKAAFRAVDGTIETVTYRAVVPGPGITVTQSATVSFTAAPGIDTSAIVASPASVVADGVATSALTVTLRDAAGGALPGKQICLTQNAAATPGAAPCPSGTGSPAMVTAVAIPVAISSCPSQAAAGTTDCQGRARFSASATTAGPVTFGLVDLTDFPDSPLGPATTVTFTAVPDEAGRSSVVADRDTAVANGGTDQSGIVSVRVTLRDGAGAALVAHAVSLRQGASTHATLTPAGIPVAVSGCGAQAPAGTSDCNGNADFTVSDTTPEVVTLQAVDLATAVTVTQSATVRFLPDEAAVSTVVANPMQVQANGGATPAGVATVTVVLNPGVPLVGHVVVLNQSAGGRSQIVATPVPRSSSGCPTEQPGGTSDCTGTVRFTVTDLTAEVVTYTAFDQTSGTALTQTATVTFLGAPPAVSSLTPATGPPVGGTVVTVTGARFATGPGQTSITFGGVPATNVSCSSATSCVATSPAAPTGTAKVVVTTASGPSTEAAVGAADFRYAVTPPAVTGVAPGSGPTSGGTIVTITGTNLAGATAVQFGTASVAVHSVNGAGTEVTAVAPAATAGTVDVRVVTAGGTSATSASARYTYANPPRPCSGLGCLLRLLGLGG